MPARRAVSFLISRAIACCCPGLIRKDVLEKFFRQFPQANEAVFVTPEFFGELLNTR